MGDAIRDYARLEGTFGFRPIRWSPTRKPKIRLCPRLCMQSSRARLSSSASKRSFQTPSQRLYSYRSARCDHTMLATQGHEITHGLRFWDVPSLNICLLACFPELAVHMDQGPLVSSGPSELELGPAIEKQQTALAGEIWTFGRRQPHLARFLSRAAPEAQPPPPPLAEEIRSSSATC